MSSPDSPRSRRRIVIWVALAAVLLVAAGAGAYVLLSGGDVSNPDVEFRAEPTETPAPSPATEARGRLRLAALRLLPDPPPLPRGPEDAAPAVQAHVVLERALAARVHARDRRGQAVRDQEQRRRLRDQPAHGQAGLAPRPGQARRLRARVRERPHLRDDPRAQRRPRTAASPRCAPGTARSSGPSRCRAARESSPLFADGHVYFGSEDGTVYALRAKDGSVAWRYKAAGAVKGAPALADGKLYFGDYGGRVHAIRQSSGKQVWSVTTHGAKFGPGSGQFYASPAVAYGRVYIGNTDANVYSFSAATGKLAWRTGTGDYVYASAAVAQVPGGKPTVYVGSYDEPLLRARRAHRQGPLEAQGAGPHLRRRHRRRRHRLLRRPAVAHHDRARRAHRPQGVPLRPRRLQPRRLRRARPLRRRLLVAVAAQAALSARTGTPAAARCCLSSATE